MPRQRISRFIVLFLILTFNLAPPTYAKEGEPQKTKLANGLTVIIQEDHSAPVAAIQVWVNVGSADEGEKEAGISHVFEHMLFKGTERRKIGEIAGEIESLGGDINAYTSFDHTVYHVTVPSRHFATALDVMADAVQRSSFDKDELAKELEVIIEEIRMNEDDPGRSLYRMVFGAAYSTHPYRRPVIGYREVVSGFKRPDMLAFFKRWYIPNNMTLVIAGDVSADAAIKAARGAFAGFKPAKDPHQKRPKEPEQKKLNAVVVEKNIKQPQLALAFHIPSLKDPDVAAIDAAAAILGGGESSRLYKKLKMEDSIVYGISAYAMSIKDPGLFFITSILDAKNTDRAVYAALSEIERLATEGPAYDELEKAKLNLESEFVYARETMDGSASKLGHFESNFGDVEYEGKYVEGVRRVSAGDIKAVVSKYLVSSAMTIAAVVPESERENVTKDTLAKAVKGYEERARAEFTLSNITPSNVTKTRLENGITVIVKETHANPTFAVYAAFPGGLRFENSKNNGIGNFTAAMLSKGTKKRNRLELARDVEDLAGGVDGFSGWNSTGASGKFLSRFFDRGMEIFADVLLNPSFPDDEVVKLKSDVASAIARQADYLPGYTFKLMYKELFKTHPYGMPVLGTVETVNSLKREDILRHYERFFAPQRMVLTIAGDVNKDYAIKKVRELFKDFNKAAEDISAPPAEPEHKGIRTTAEKAVKEQTHIAIGFHGAAIGDDDSYPLKVMTEILAGQGGRLFINLRDKKSLAYSLHAVSKEGKDRGVFAVYLAVAPEKKDMAVAAVLNELREISSAKATEAEITRAKNSIIGGYEIALQEVSSKASNMANNELYGLGYAFDEKFHEKISAVTADDISRVASKYLTLDAYTLAVVGPDAKK
ncbi:MAG: insulinase family protein [Deltaproteobacteria bacterium]|nr:insulinase family protein [Deltaproteobacteria bacterium]